MSKFLKQYSHTKYQLIRKITYGFISIITVVGFVAIIGYFYYINNNVKITEGYKADTGAQVTSQILKNVPLENYLKNGKDDKYTEYEKALTQVCQDYGLRYIYVYIPDLKNNTVKVVFYVSDKGPTIPNRKLGTIVNWTLSDVEREAFTKGKHDRFLEMNNALGHTVSKFAPVYYNNESIAIVGSDVDFSIVYKDITLNFAKVFSLMALSLLLIYLILISYIKRIVIYPITYISYKMNKFLKSGTTQIEPISITSEDEIASMADSFNEMVSKINTYIKKITDMQDETIFSLAKLAQSRDDDTGKHLERVKLYCKLLSDELAANSIYKDEISQERIETLMKASALHDIGKVGIPDKILLKQGRLTDEEYEVIKKHTTIGRDTLAEVHNQFGNNSFIEVGMIIAYCHHERWDGKGYPQGISGLDIPLEARIMALADVYDAISSKRVYKDAFPQEKCIQIIKEGRGTQFDPVLVDAFLAIQDKFLEARLEFEKEVSSV